ncbi:MAG: dihydrolipoamide acetyltransferase family protein, partial [Phycisphaerae bacterium]
GQTAAPAAADRRTAGAPVAAGGVSRMDSTTGVAAVPRDEARPKRTTAPAAPAVRKLARERGIDLDRVVGTGPGGRITRKDLDAHGAGSAPAAPLTEPAPSVAADTPPGGPPTPGTARGASAVGGAVMPGQGVERFVTPPGEPGTDKWGAIRRAPLSQIRKTIAKQMVRSAYTAPHVTHGDEADVTELDRIRRELTEITGGDPKVTLMPFLIRAVCVALRRYPIFNASFDDEGAQIIYKDYINIGVAVDTPRGLIVPVIAGADKLSVVEIAATLRRIAERIRNTQFAIEDLRGGTFTITNVGALGGTFSTPIINYPEVAILGLGRSRRVPVVRDDKVTAALVLPLNLSFDHRAAHGAAAARFTADIKSYLEKPLKLLLH